MPERTEKPVAPVPWGPQQGDGGGPKSPDVSKPDTRDLLEENAQGGSEPIEALPAAHRPVTSDSLGGQRRISRRFCGGRACSGDGRPSWIRGLRRGAANFTPTQATTILAFKFTGGVLVAGDRRATAGNTVVYDRADKVLEIDRHSIMAIAGVPATAWEMARVLEHSLQYFRRTQLQEMSVDGKVRALSKLLRDNFGFVMQGDRRGGADFRDLRFRGRRAGAALFLRRDGRAIRGDGICRDRLRFAGGARRSVL